MSVREFQIVLLLLAISKSVLMTESYWVARKSTRLSRMPMRYGKRSSFLTDDSAETNDNQDTRPYRHPDSTSTNFMKLQETLSQLSFLLSKAAHKAEEVKLDDKLTPMYFIPLLIVNPKALPATSSLSRKKRLDPRSKGLSIFFRLDDDFNDSR